MLPHPSGARSNPVPASPPTRRSQLKATKKRSQPSQRIDAESRRLISGWQRACTAAGAAWGGGESPVLPGLVAGDAIELAGTAVGQVPCAARILDWVCHLHCCRLMGAVMV